MIIVSKMPLLFYPKLFANVPIEQKLYRRAI